VVKASLLAWGPRNARDAKHDSSLRTLAESSTDVTFLPLPRPSLTTACSSGAG
jgi:hypothetical protein